MFDKIPERGIRFKFLCITSGILFISSLCASAIISFNEKELLENSLITKGKSFISYIAKISQDPLIMKERVALDSIVSEANKDDDILYTVIFDAQDTPVTSQYASINYHSQKVAKILQKLSKDSEFPNIIAAIKEQETIVELSIPIQTGTDTIGKVVVGMSKSRIREQTVKTVLFVLLLNLAVACFIIAMLFIATRSMILDPLTELVHATTKLATGELAVRVNVNTTGELKILVDSFNKMAEELQKTTVSKDYVHNIVNTMPCALIVTDLQGVIVASNQGTLLLLGYEESEIIGEPISKILSTEDIPDIGHIRKLAEQGEVLRTEKACFTKDGDAIPVLFSAGIVSDGDDGKLESKFNMVCIILDIRDRKKLEIELRLAQKLESIGQLAAGIAHEINTPIQFVGDNLHFMKGAFQDILFLSAVPNTVKSDDLSNPSVAKDLFSRIREKEEEIDLDFLREEIPQAIEQSLEGLQRVSRIVLAMREFSHPGGENKTNMDINRAIESTITLTRNEWKYAADLITTFAPNLPEVQGYPADFNQVILNLIVNAAQTVQHKIGKDGKDKGKIEISTREDGNEVEICIRDSGMGIPPEAQSRIFDPFFTTKEVGKGTGQGLAIAQNIIVHKHGGKIYFETTVGEGTSFYIRLPLEKE
jgi:PAS domain S-box-containing protein